MSVCMVYITAESMEDAEIIGRNLVSRRLAACVNIISNMKSIYQWEGKIETGNEVIIKSFSEDPMAFVHSKDALYNKIAHTYHQVSA